MDIDNNVHTGVIIPGTVYTIRLLADQSIGLNYAQMETLAGNNDYVLPVYFPYET